MRLLRLHEDGDLSLAEFFGNDIPPYAILSHTWGADHEEVSFKDVIEELYKCKIGYAKVQFCGKQAAKDDLQYFWVDTCCIDKSSSAELAEAINSMFRWYQNANRCYVYLPDVSISDSADGNDHLQRWKPSFRRSRWFTRGWTLQELIAPSSVEFFSLEEQLLGNKQSLESTLHEITGISVQALRGTPLSEFSVDERMSWADQRNTKREEDKAYSLLGIFNIYMPLIYGEGKKNAYGRLQKEIRGIQDTGSSAIQPALSTDLPKTANHIQIRDDGGVMDQKIQQRKELLDLLFFDHIDERLLSLKAAHTRTCKWFLEKDIYRAWISADNVEEHHGFLWIKGKPGAGKSTLMKFLDSKAKGSAKSKPNSLVASFFFNARGDQLERSTTGVYRSLLWQVLEKAPDLQSALDELDSNTRRIVQNKGWHQEILKHTLRSIVEQLGCRTLQLYIDALDECEDKDVTDMISFFEDLGELAVEANVRLHICFSSRHYPTVVIRHGKQIILEDEADHDDDIIRYINAKLKLSNPKKAADLKAQILKKSAGVFLWVVLVIPMLNKASAKGRIEELQRCLEEIPPELDDLFEIILKRDQEDMRDLELCVQWILFAKRPLKQEEYFFALRIPESSSEVAIHQSDEYSDEDMRCFIDSSSKGLAQVTKTRSKDKTPTVQFIHESVRDFFLVKKGYLRLWPALSDRFESHSHEELRDRCMAEVRRCYGSQALANIPSLHFMFHSSGGTPPPGHWVSLDQSLPVAKSEEASFLRRTVSADLPFLRYAVENVLYHADAAKSDAKSREIFLREFPLKCWIFLNNIWEQHQIRRYTSEASLLYILAEKSLPSLIKQELSQVPHMDIPGERYGFPLWAACANGSRSAVMALLMLQSTAETDKHIASKIDDLCNAKFDRHQTPLYHYAFTQPDEAIVKLLLKNAKIDFNFRSRRGKLTPLTATILCENTSMTKLLLESGHCDVNVGSGTPLFFAVANADETITKLLLASNRVDVNCKDISRNSPLSEASKKGNIAIVKLLLETGQVDINCKDMRGRTPLDKAMAMGHKAVVTLLQSYGHSCE